MLIYALGSYASACQVEEGEIRRIVFACAFLTYCLSSLLVADSLINSVVQREKATLLFRTMRLKNRLRTERRCRKSASMILTCASASKS